MSNFPNYCLDNANIRRLPSRQGFSLIELVVVIAILGILVSIALPFFKNLTQRAKVAQAQNALVGLVKECNVAITKDEEVSMDIMKTAKGSLSSYRLYSGSDAETLGACIKLYEGRSVITADAQPLEFTDEDKVSEYPLFFINLYLDTGLIEKKCIIKEYTKNKEGCTQSTEMREVCVPNPGNRPGQPKGPDICWDEPVEAFGRWS